MIDYATLTIVLVIMIAFCMPFVYSHQKKKQHEKKLVNSFMAKSQEYQLSISTYELWRRTYVIGMDKSSHQLLHIKFGPETKVNLVDLKKIKKVKVLNEQREIGSGKEKEKVVDKLWLSLSYADPKVPDALLEFYDAEESLGLMGEPLLIEKWKILVKEKLDDLHQQVSGKSQIMETSRRPL